MDESSSDDTATRKSIHYRQACSKHCSSVQTQEVLCTSSSEKFLLTEIDTELSESASSISTGTVARKHGISLSKSHFVGSKKWEVEYVEVMLLNVDLMFKDFALGRACEIINPNIFELLENRKEVLETQGNESKLKQKLLFDCVGECMDLRCRTWAEGLSTLRRKLRPVRRPSTITDLVALDLSRGCLSPNPLDRGKTSPTFSSEPRQVISAELARATIGVLIRSPRARVLSPPRHWERSPFKDPRPSAKEIEQY
ncbi:hypothetical protein Acr_29g0008780 [Actinidia rufa]|uniref:DUF4378 domain-containing protein n=1 Tax=Actinidia rufa TaxID=165716 RepID=A0A7J0HF12_9ERIC|nr:hypothetical protein Acr_29g0008780 [Actinidia rufa]